MKMRMRSRQVGGMDDDKDQVVEETEKVVDDVEIKLATQDKAICEVGRMEVVHTPSPGPYVAELDGCDMDMVQTLSLGSNDTHRHGLMIRNSKNVSWSYW